MVKLFLNKPHILCLPTVKYFQVLRFNTNYSKGFKSSKWLNSSRWPTYVLQLRVGVYLGVLAMKGYSTFPKFLGLKLHHQMLLSVISGYMLSLPLCRDAVSVFYCPKRLGLMTGREFELCSLNPFPATITVTPSLNCRKCVYIYVNVCVYKWMYVYRCECIHAQRT